MSPCIVPLLYGDWLYVTKVVSGERGGRRGVDVTWFVNHASSSVELEFVIVVRSIFQV